MKNKSKLIIPIIIYISIISTLLFVFCSWIVTSTSELRPSEITTIIDLNLGEYNLENSFEYFNEPKFPHMNLDNTDVGSDGKTKYGRFISTYSVYYYKADSSGKIDLSDSSENPYRNAGSYYARYYNINDKIYTDYFYTIYPTEPIFNLKDSPSFDFTKKYLYSPSLRISDSDFTYSGVNGDSLGTNVAITHRNTFVDGNKDNLIMRSTYTLSTSNANYKDATISNIEIKLQAVARIESYYYSRIENALSKAKSGEEVRIVLGVNPTIYDDCTIKEGVTLHINYADDSQNSSQGTLSGISGFVATSNAKNIVTLHSGKTINIVSGGILEIGGQLSGGGADRPCGATQGSFSNLVLESNSKIESDGVIKCYGYILESSSNNGSYINANKGEIYLPFIIRDFRGGTITSGIYTLGGAPCPPFNQFEFRNIHPTLFIQYNAALFGYANIYASSQQNDTIISFISSVGSSFIQLTDKTYSYVKCKYNLTNECSTISMYGGAKTNSMSMNIGGTNVTIDNCYFPLTFRQNIELNVNIEKGQQFAKYNLTQQFKLMPGSSLIVGQNVTATASTLSIYKESDYTITTTVGSVPYPSGKGDAQLIINGELQISSLGGTAKSQNNGAFLFINSKNQAVVKEPTSSTSMIVRYSEATIKSQLYTSATNSYGDASVGVYQSSQNSYLENGKTYYIWDSIPKDNLYEYRITFVTNSEDTTVDTQIIYSLNNQLEINSSILPQASTLYKYGHKFVNWYLDNNTFDNLANGTTINADTNAEYTSITLYGDWEIADYSILYEFLSSDDTEKFNLRDQISDCPVIYTINTNSSDIINSLPELVLEGYKFMGWYYKSADEYVTIDSFNTAFAEDIVFYARFLKKQKPFQIEYILLGDPDITPTGTIATGIEDISSVDLNNYDIIKNIKSQYGNTLEGHEFVKYYFEGYDSSDYTGWYLDSNFDQELTTFPNSGVDKGGECQIITIYGKLIKKNKFTYEDNDQEFYYIPGSDAYTQKITADSSDTIRYMWDNQELGTSNIFRASEAAFKAPAQDTHFVKVEFIKVTLNKSNSQPKVTCTSRIINSSYERIDALEEGTAYFEYLGNTEATGATITVTPNHTSYKNNPSYSTSITCGSYSKSSTTLNAQVTGSLYLKSAYTITVSATGDNSCVTGDTLITLADGSKKRIDQLSIDDILLAFNHFTGVYEPTRLAALVYHGDDVHNVMKLHFGDGSYIELIGRHGLFNATLNEYSHFDLSTCYNYIGHEFIKYNNGVNTKVKLEKVEIIQKYVGSYTLITSENLNSLANDMLNITTGMFGLYNIFEYDENHMFDSQKYEEDIEKYGLYDYSVFEKYCEEKTFIDFGGKYFAVSIGKGYVDFETIVGYIYWLENMVQNGEAQTK